MAARYILIVVKAEGPYLPYDYQKGQKMDKILVVDDQPGVCHSFKKILSRHGYDVITVLSGQGAVELAGKEIPSLVFMDVSMPKMDGLETLKLLKSLYPDLTVIMMTAYSTSDKAITAMKYGAYDYITKPVDKDNLLALVDKVITAGKMSKPVTFEGEALQEGDRIIGKSPGMFEIYKKIGQIADTDVTV
ncbi:sigma-54-dependent Fis family transcriptional regulator, partial [bacterium]